jgi:hypothetical protein
MRTRDPPIAQSTNQHLFNSRTHLIHPKKENNDDSTIANDFTFDDATDDFSLIDMP